MKQDDLISLIIKLFQVSEELNVEKIALKAGLLKSKEADRKNIQRALVKLIKIGLIEVRGSARARVYFLKKEQQSEQDILFENFKNKDLLQYVSQPLQKRIAVGYDANFLLTYEPNKTFYLSQVEQLDLLQIGQVEKNFQLGETYVRKIWDRLLIDLSWNSSRLEGNTYSLLETKRLIDLNEVLDEKSPMEAQMILNHKRAINYILKLSPNETLTLHEIRSIHALLSENLLGNPSSSGRIREILVRIEGTVYSPLDNHYILKEYLELFINKFNLIKNPFEQSFFSLVHLSYLQAFEDVNKRTFRLVANIPFIKNNLKPLSFTDVNQISYVKSLLGIYEKQDYNLFKDLYLWAYKKSCEQYSAFQKEMPNLLRLKYYTQIQDIIRRVILEKTLGKKIVEKIKNLIIEKDISIKDTKEVLKIIELEIIDIHEGKIAQFNLSLEDFEEWKKLQ